MTNLNEQEIQNAWGAVGEEENNGGGQREERKIDFLDIPEGNTKVRLLDPIPYAYKEWWSPKANEGKGGSIPYMGADDLLEAENKAFMDKIFKEADERGLKDKARKDFLRDEGYKKQPWGRVKQKYMIHVLDRATGEIKLMDKGPAIFNKIKKHATNPEYGDPRKYDITINREGSGLNTEYTVTPARNNTDLTEQELALYEANKVDIEKLKAVDMTPEQAYEIAKGATWKQVLGNNSEGSEEKNEKADPNSLPPEENTSEGAQNEPQEESAPERKDEPVNVDKGEALSEEELNNIEF